MRPASPGAVDSIQPANGDLNGSGRIHKQMFQPSTSIIPNVSTSEASTTISINGNPVTLVKKASPESKKLVVQKKSEKEDIMDGKDLDATQ